MNEDRAASLLTGFSRVRVLVLGDVMLDRFIYGQIERISPEAPVPVFSAQRETVTPGGAANVARNIASLGGKAVLVGVAGSDDSGDCLRGLLEAIAGIESDIILVGGRPTTVKNRLVAAGQQIIRMDREERGELGDLADEILARFERHLRQADIVILSDYAKGVLSPEVVSRAISASMRAAKPVVVDPKHADAGRYDGATLLAPNLGEAAQMAGMAGTDDRAVAAMAGAIFAAAPQVKSLVITRGADGMTAAERNGAISHLPVAAREVADVSGAGDTVVAVLSLALAVGCDLRQAAELANVAAGVAVGKLGTAAVMPGELAGALQSGKIGEIVAKTAGAAKAMELAASWRREGLRVGFTNGCFDLIHPGHVSLLQTARSHCDRLIVGLNTDASVKRLKGPGRPIQDELARAVVVGALSVVDLVVLFSEDTPLELIKLIRPDVLVKGADYTLETVVGADFVRSYNGRVVLVDLAPGQSTSGLLNRIEANKA